MASPLSPRALAVGACGALLSLGALGAAEPTPAEQEPAPRPALVTVELPDFQRSVERFHASPYGQAWAMAPGLQAHIGQQLAMGPAIIGMSFEEIFAVCNPCAAVSTAWCVRAGAKSRCSMPSSPPPG